MNNAVFGKTMENIRKRINFRLVCNEKKVKKLVAKSTFLDRTIYGENIVGMHFEKTKLVFNKAIYVGMSILDISKTRMYNFHYSIMKPLFNNNIQICYMDTDSFIYVINSIDIYKDLQNIAIELDTSNYPKEHVMYPELNKGVIGKFKD